MNWNGFCRLLALLTALFSIPVAAVVWEIHPILWWVTLVIAYAICAAWWHGGFNMESVWFILGMYVLEMVFLWYWVFPLVWLGGIASLVLLLAGFVAWKNS